MPLNCTHKERDQRRPEMKEPSRVVVEADDVMHLKFCRKRKLCFQHDHCSGDDVELQENQVSPKASSLYKCDIGTRRLRSPDLQEGTEISLSFNGVIREETPILGNSELAKSMANYATKSTKKRASASVSPRRKFRASLAKNPSAEELEEFFAAAETNARTRFAEKYNYDIVKDIPLEGRYQWVRLHSQK